ncbi:MAG: UDP-N-acetylglucosamine 1-carboxyvinyltransferase [Meiothermus sp.]|uniref:UDP-N-acetylglucosamine 1-carboxyvinyltransferase n=1 Tax=Meiothermus sp. TaxID=1955249 RepID=UPI0025E2492C|nr:UDP-N-acetylglucosamine 1-carboxyvinyltransferase [Meiothermus sp.]MCS7194166.1 UDP-N-acetylglucosamine 1-carboxyvinyltransferase [Meiothermus sp.]MCX7740630.1 UDP-N-acetylglucosamine 1-carboxyvinyltransferase [Meiothermus sp.]MDW8090027.1 UDP-N-acetylglucosamine 1-carboxyvinyltransferase [Meiothermus sp.]
MGRVLVVRGGVPLRGELRVLPAKNSALKLMAASLLTDEPVVLEEVPRLRDIDVMLELLGHLGTRHAWEGRTLHLHTPEIRSTQAPFELVSKMRASFNLLGALAARAGEGTVPLPGGCTFAERPVDQHIKALRALGFEVVAQVTEGGMAYTARRVGPASGRVVYDLPTLGGTEQALLAAALGGEAVLVNTPQEPEIVDLCRFLVRMGVEIEGIGSGILHIRGRPRLRGVRYRVIPDRIEAGTYLLAAAATRGSITLTHVEPFHMDALLEKLRQSGHRITMGRDWVRLEAVPDPQPFNLEAREYPGFVTDLQPPATAYLCTVPGTSLVSDRIYPDRFTHAGELARMGANITLKDRTLIIQGRPLSGAAVEARDIRAGGSLIIAALAAEGETHIAGLHHIERGYEDVENRLRSLGAQVGLQQPELALAAD